MNKANEIEAEIRRLIEHFQLELLPVEGVLFHQTYRSRDLLDPSVLPERYAKHPGSKPAGTCVIAMFTAATESSSIMHRLLTDEIWHFYRGDPIEMLMLHPDGRSEQLLLGHDVFNGQRLQVVVPHGTWMGARLKPGGHYALFGNTMSPGFTSFDFEAGIRAELIAQYPQAREMITALTHAGDQVRHMPEGY
jgi:uncharacterized protein